MSGTNRTPECDDIRSQVLQQEADWERALGMNDAARLDEVMADDWRMISAEGQVITKARALSALRSGVLKYDSVTFAEVEVRAYAGAAVVMGYSREIGNLGGVAFDNSYIFTDVFLPHHDSWRSVLTHATRVTR